MAELNIYQIILIVVLLLNLLVWFTVICIRLFCTAERRGYRRNRLHSSLRRQLARRRLSFGAGRRNRDIDGVGNLAFSAQDEDLNGQPYNISQRLDVPPTYEEAIRFPNYQRMPVHNASSRIPVTYEQQVVLTVPEEPTSTSETRLISTLNSATTVQRQEISPPPVSNDINNSVLSGDDVSISDYPFVFTAMEIGPQAAKTLNITETSIHLIDGQLLQTDSKA